MIKIKKNALFNEDVKEQFLETIKEGTQSSYRRIFVVTGEFERMLNKDINLFDKDEINTILYSFKSKNKNTVESYSRIISSYLNWCVKNNLIEENILSKFTSNDFEKYVVTDLTYMSDKDIRRVEDLSDNYQDAIIVRLLFIGIGGKNLSEIRNLQKDDIDFENNEIRLINSLTTDDSGLPLKYTERTLEIDERTSNMLQGAIDQKIYSKRNGNLDQTATNNIRPYTDLVSNNYVVRPSITRTENWHIPVDKFVIYRRLKMLQEVLGLKKLNTKHIQRSGMLYYANDLMAGDEVQLDDLKIIGHRFGIKSYHNLKGIVTTENVNKIYNKQE